MGLDTSHDCWHGPYSSFMRWRRDIARAAGLPPLDLMEGFYSEGSPIHDPFWRQGADSEENSVSERLARQSLPIKWDCLKPNPLHILLHHSDCEGEIEAEDCEPIAAALEKLLPLVGDWRDKTQQFVDGLRRAAKAGENVDFH